MKVFLNICSADCVPKPPPITDDELRRRVEEAERDNLTVSYRLPMSLGELRIDKDNKGNVSYDNNFEIGIIYCVKIK